MNMNNKAGHHSLAEINSIFARLDPRDVEQFYRSYHLWMLYQQIAGLQRYLTVLHQRIAENNEHMQQAHPSAIALATLARLQSNGVNDIHLLDRMLERGEVWLDQTMQRLAYCEQFDFIRNNYTEWCENALDGAYDWIDSMQEANALSSPEKPILMAASPAGANDSLSAATEEILLQKLMSEEEDAASLLEPTLKRPAVPSAAETAPPMENLSATGSRSSLARTPAEQPLALEQVEVAPPQEETETEQAPEELLPLETAEEQPTQPVYIVSTGEADEPQAQVAGPTEEVIYSVEEQAAQLEREEPIPSAEEVILAEVEVSYASEAPASSAGQATELEQAEQAQEEVIPTETDDTPGVSPDIGDQAIPSEQVEAESVQPYLDESSKDGTLSTGEVYAAGDSAIPEAPHLPAEQISPVEDVKPIPAAEEVMPVEINGASDSTQVPAEYIPTEEAVVLTETSDTIEQEEGSAEQAEVEPVSDESEEVTLVEIPAILAIAEVSLPAADEKPWQWNEPMPSEVNIPSSQLSVQQSSEQTSEPALPRKKRGFLYRLLAMLFRKKPARR